MGLFDGFKKNAGQEPSEQSTDIQPAIPLVFGKKKENNIGVSDDSSSSSTEEK